MPLSEKLLPGSYKGAPFLIRRGDTSGGRKTVTHEYPNSDRRFVEDLGLLQRSFSVEATITGSNDDYLQVRDRLIDALESQGPGLLVHPFFGNVQASAISYSLNEDITRLNDTSITINFQRSESNIFPEEGSSNISKISGLRNGVFDSIQGNISNLFEVSRFDGTNFADAQSLLTDVATAFSQNLDQVTNDTVKLSSFQVIVDEFVDNINANILDPDSLAVDFVNLFTSANETAATATDQYNLFKLFYDFGDDDVVIVPTTVSREQRLENRNVINTSMQIGALTQSYAASSLLTYENNQQLTETRQDLEDQYQKIIENDLNNQTDTRLQLTATRNESRIFFEKESVNVPRLLDVTTRQKPLTVLAYSFYGDTDRVEQLNNLNQFENPTFVQGDVTILTGIDGQ